jgi:ribose transport system ATP-binding protein
MVGAGRTELFEGIVGLRPSRVGAVRLNGKTLAIHTPSDAIEAGLGYLTEDRKTKGLLLKQKMAPNLTLTVLSRFHNKLFLDTAREKAAMAEAVEKYDIRAANQNALAGQLSGGNQQKLLLAKILMADPKVIIIDEPTRGIDIGNKGQIYSFIQRLVQMGRSCVVISSEMQELIGICHRILVMRGGRIAGELSGDQMTEANVAMFATGVQKGELQEMKEAV